MIKLVVCFLLSLCFVFFLGMFVFMEFIPTEWTYDQRKHVVVFGCIFSFWACLILGLKESNKIGE